MTYQVIFTVVLLYLSTNVPVLAVVVEQNSLQTTHSIDVALPEAVQLESVEHYTQFRKLKGTSKDVLYLIQTMKQLQTIGEPVMRSVKTIQAKHFFEIDLFERSEASISETKIKNNYPDFISSFKKFDFEPHSAIKVIESRIRENEIILEGETDSKSNVAALMQSLSNISNVNLKHFEKREKGYYFMMSMTE